VGSHSELWESTFSPMGFIGSLPSMEVARMGLFTVFELFLVVLTFYAIVRFEGGTRILVPILCLVVIFLLERLQGRLREEEEAKRRLLRYAREDLSKKL